MTKRLLAVAAALTFALTGCAGAAATTSADTSTPDAITAVEDGATLIDVRTPEEFDAGHLDGALNLDWNAGTLDAGVADLPKDDTYVVYCRSGNRSAQATARMKELGFTSVIDGGAYDDLK